MITQRHFLAAFAYPFSSSCWASKELFNTHISAAEPFLLGTILYVTNEGILCALSVSFDKYTSDIHFVLLKAQNSCYTADSKIDFFTCVRMLHVFTLVSSG